MSVTLQLGARVRRKNDIGMDTPGAVVRVKDSEAMVYWPDDGFYQVLAAVELEPYGSLQGPIAA